MDNMDKSTTQQEMPKPHRGKTTSSTDTSDLTTDIEVSVLASINKKLDLLGALHNKINKKNSYQVLNACITTSKNSRKQNHEGNDIEHPNKQHAWQNQLLWHYSAETTRLRVIPTHNLNMKTSRLALYPQLKWRCFHNLITCFNFFQLPYLNPSLNLNQT